MRWKLLLITSVLAALAGAGASLGLVRYLGLGTVGLISSPGLLALGTLVIPVAAITFASIFVYRHTARRRPLQALATALLSTILTLASLFLGSIFLTRPAPSQPPPRPTPSLTMK